MFAFTRVVYSMCCLAVLAIVVNASVVEEKRQVDLSSALSLATSLAADASTITSPVGVGVTLGSNGVGVISNTGIITNTAVSAASGTSSAASGKSSAASGTSNAALGVHALSIPMPLLAGLLGVFTSIFTGAWVAL